MNFKPQIKTLSNGMRFVSLNMPQSQSVTAMIMVKVGSRYEEEKIAGISHFLEHMVFKGTKKYHTAFDLTSTVDALGAEFNAFTGKEYTGFYVKSAVNHLETALSVLSQLVFHPLLQAKEMEKEKGVVIEEINMTKDIPMSKVRQDFETLLYSSTHLGRPTIGYKKTVMQMKRKDFLDFRNKWYRPERMVLGVVGGINKNLEPRTKNLEYVEKYFSPRHSGAKRSCHSGASAIESNRDPITSFQDDTCSLQDNKTITFSQEKPQLKVKYKKTKQAHFCLGVRAFPRNHKDKYVVAVLSTILGGNMSSRLFTEVREKRGLAYYIKSDINTYFDNGYLVSQAGTDIRKAPEAIKVILNVLSSIIYHLSSIELKRAKEYLKGKMALGLEDSKGIASLFVEDLLLENKIRTPKQIINGVEKVSLSDIKRVAKEIFVNKGLNLAVIGPYKNKTEFEKILGL